MPSIRQLKVKPKSLIQASPCAAELSTMLACWAASGDRMSSNECASSARALQECMAQSAAAGKRGKIRKPTINYHLARLGKNL